MFRRENPQRGRFRQFSQVGVEYIGSPLPIADAEVTALFSALFKAAGVASYSHLEINSVGCGNCRPKYLEKLNEYLNNNKTELCADCNRRMDKNPLRVLDCKIEKCRPIIDNAPSILDSLCDNCNAHFQAVLENLTLLGVEYKLNRLLVRGLDYYVRTAFEMVTDKLGAASAIGGGGRYDGLVEILGGPNVSGVGFAIGLDRIVALLKMAEKLSNSPPVAYIISFEETAAQAVKLLGFLRNNGLKIEFDLEGRSIKSQMKQADRFETKYAIIVGANELKNGCVTVKELSNASQSLVNIEDLQTFLQGGTK
jgi:histidyl-tRNA synthetase